MSLQSTIESRVQEAFSPQVLNVIDDSAAHHGHAGHREGGSHFMIEIKADALANLSRVEAHRKIYALFTDLMPDPLHALRIIILK